MRETSLYCLVGTSSRDNTRPPPPSRRVYTSVRELGDHDGSSPGTNSVTWPPPAGTTQISKFPICDVKAIHLPSGDQLGLVGFSTPRVGTTSRWPPVAGSLHRTRRSLIFVA